MHYWWSWLWLGYVYWQIFGCYQFQGTPAGARHIPLPILFSPLFLLHGAAVLFSASRLIEKIVLLLQSGAGTGLYFRFSSRAHDCLGFLHHGSRYWLFGFQIDRNFYWARLCSSWIDTANSVCLKSGYWVGGQLMKEVERNRPDFTMMGFLG